MKPSEHRYILGLVDYENRGTRDHRASITWQLSADGEFTMQADLLQPNKRDSVICGQCVDRIAAYFPQNAKAQRMLAIWERWHLNHMRAGSPAQEAYLREHVVTVSYPATHFDVASKALAAAGLNPDPNYLHNGKPYIYGTAWLAEEMPPEVLAEIQSWSRES